MIDTMEILQKRIPDKQHQLALLYALAQAERDGRLENKNEHD